MTPHGSSRYHIFLPSGSDQNSDRDGDGQPDGLGSIKRLCIVRISAASDQERCIVVDSKSVRIVNAFYGGSHAWIIHLTYLSLSVPTPMNTTFPLTHRIHFGIWSHYAG
ncbi:hypothetical protein LIA77_00147 [Sarocladium implicatum]|nr:hypothetical protein LIA77_00147 [Sarocladium implicatum]